MKKVISVSLALVLVLALTTTGVFAAGQGYGLGQAKQGFSDTKGHWGDAAITNLQGLGILNGYADGTFRPDEVLTAEQLAVILEALTEKRLGIDDEGAATLEEEDMDALAGVPKWARESVGKGVKNGYLNMKRFHSGEQCDRLTAMVQLAKALGLAPVTNFENNPFKDRGLMNDEDFGYVMALYQAGFIKGYPDGNFNPNGLLNRAQIASIIDGIFEEPDEDSPDTTAPVWPTASAITASAITTTGLTLKWNAATDAEGVALYRIQYTLDNVAKERFAYTSRTAAITGLQAGTQYTFTVQARDAAGNWSTGLSVTVTTKTSADTTAPVWPTGSAITVSAVTTEGLTLRWNAAEDEEGVALYRIRYTVKNVLQERLAYANRTAVITGLQAGTEYTFTVQARDAAGNWSAGLSITAATED